MKKLIDFLTIASFLAALFFGCVGSADLAVNFLAWRYPQSVTTPPTSGPTPTALPVPPTHSSNPGATLPPGDYYPNQGMGSVPPTHSSNPRTTLPPGDYYPNQGMDNNAQTVEHVWRDYARLLFYLSIGLLFVTLSLGLLMRVRARRKG